MLGSALERILNPRVIDQIPLPEKKLETVRHLNPLKNFNRRTTVGLALIMIAFVIMTSSSKTKIFASQLIKNGSPSQAFASRGTTPESIKNNVTLPVSTSATTDQPGSVAKISFTPTALSLTSTMVTSLAATSTPTFEPTYTSIPIASLPTTYVLHKGEYPYCIARRFNIDPNELLTLNSLRLQQNFYVGTVLKIPQTERTFPGERILQTHPTTYTVFTPNETVYSVACIFGDVDPIAIAQLNNLSLDSMLLVGQQLNIP